jgi:hypothetical protein
MLDCKRGKRRQTRLRAGYRHTEHLINSFPHVNRGANGHCNDINSYPNLSTSVAYISYPRSSHK